MSADLSVSFTFFRSLNSSEPKDSRKTRAIVLLLPFLLDGIIQEAQPLSVVLAVIPSAILAVRFFRGLPKRAAYDMISVIVRFLLTDRSAVIIQSIRIYGSGRRAAE